MMASPDVSNLGEIEWTYTLSFRVTYCRNGNELLIVGTPDLLCASCVDVDVDGSRMF
jgi:hypothetical protein